MSKPKPQSCKTCMFFHPRERTPSGRPKDGTRGGCFPTGEVLRLYELTLPPGVDPLKLRPNMVFPARYSYEGVDCKCYREVGK